MCVWLLCALSNIRGLTAQTFWNSEIKTFRIILLCMHLELLCTERIKNYIQKKVFIQKITAWNSISYLIIFQRRFVLEVVIKQTKTSAYFHCVSHPHHFRDLQISILFFTSRLIISLCFLFATHINHTTYVYEGMSGRLAF